MWKKTMVLGWKVNIDVNGQKSACHPIPLGHTNLYNLIIDWCHSGPNFALGVLETLNRRRCSEIWLWLCMLALILTVGPCLTLLLHAHGPFEEPCIQVIFYWLLFQNSGWTDTWFCSFFSQPEHQMNCPCMVDFNYFCQIIYDNTIISV